ncbi:hypothetical protein M9H77_26530 [Catharanthus roseus]|uniref:Uncharacterized protein n=1 Tax=Catharanthus roseus TaxID=4058 RepID=A0ACC0ACN2_CATRO|nr:hypothetical protein M9H77_26530 [Catharanthus roseus]
MNIRNCMKEVPAHVHLGPIVPDVLTRQHGHRSGLIWSRDHETSTTDLQCRRFDRNLFQAYSGALRRILRPAVLTIGGLHRYHHHLRHRSLVLQRKSRPSSASAWFVSVVPWVALHLSLIFSRHFQYSHRGLGTSYAPPPPGTVGSSIQARPLPGLEFSSFHAPPPPSIVSSSY